jgi:hypothetical protein
MVDLLLLQDQNKKLDSTQYADKEPQDVEFQEYGHAGSV